jgi:uncharacterized protein YjiS (DUF1127 family)
MAYINTTTTVTLSDRVKSAYRGTATRLKQYRIYRNTVNELGALSDRDLSDLAIHRSQIGRIAYEASRAAA